MKIPVDEKNLRIMLSSIGDVLLVADLIELAGPLSIYKVCFTSARAM